MISRAAPSRPTPTRSKLGAWWIERGIPGSSLISMARARRLDSVPCPRRKTCLRPFAGWMRSVPLATPGASVGKWCGRAPSSVRPTLGSRLGTFGNRGNGRYRTELREAPLSHRSLSHGTPAPPGVRPAAARWTIWHRGRALRRGWFRLCDPRQRLHRARSSARQRRGGHLPPDQFQQRPESPLVRSLYDCPAVPVGPEGVLCRVVVATHPESREEEPGWPHTGGRRVFPLLHEAAAAGIHRLRCGRGVSASRRHTRLSFQTRIPSKTRIAGALTRP